MLFQGICCFFILKKLTLPAAAMKNIKLTDRDMAGSIPIICVNHKIRMVPPPTPKPERNPRRIPADIATGMEFNIDIAHLPKESECLKCDADILWEFCFLHSLIENRR